MGSKTRRSKSRSSSKSKSRSRSSSNPTWKLVEPTWKSVGPIPKKFYTYKELEDMDKQFPRKLKVLSAGTKVEIKSKTKTPIFDGLKNKKTLTGKFVGFYPDEFLIKFDDKIYIDQYFDVRRKDAFLFRIIEVPVY